MIYNVICGQVQVPYLRIDISLHARSRVDDHDSSEIQQKLSHGVEDLTFSETLETNSVGIAS